MRLYLVEGLTAAEVADVLGPPYSRAAVVSKMRRLGLLKRDFRATTRAAPAPNRARRLRGAALGASLPPQAPPQPLPPLREIGATGSPAPLAALPRGACHWPLDDPGPGRMHLALFCGGPARGHVYCADHRALAVRQPR
ncbi:MAG TPA: GcrA family cell cycle regulator [Caulobacteraceae bacterium]